MNKTILGDSVLNLQILKQHTTVVVEPTSQMGGTYDSAEITTVFTVNNDQEREVEFILPYSTVKFSASLAVISAGEQIYLGSSHTYKRLAYLKTNTTLTKS